MKTVENYHFKDKKALVRVDFNVPLNDQFQITDTTRIDAAVPTLMKILNDGGAIILMSHLGRPKEGPEEKFSLKHITGYLSQVLHTQVQFADDCIGDQAVEKAAGLHPGDVLLLENLRFHKEETKGNEDFAGKLARLGDVYVNDAFGSAHRAHASTAIIAGFFPENKMFGYLMASELENINKVLVSARHPFTAILGGAKVSGKIEIINHLMDKVDNLIIGGGMMFTFLRARGGQIGSSLVEDELLDVAKTALYRAKELGVNLMIPVDAVAASEFNNDAQHRIVPADQIPDGWMGLDIGPETRRSFAEIIQHSSTILWNGPMGVFEMPNFEAGTRFIAEAIAAATQKGAFSLIGGGDSVAAINKYHLAHKVSYVSTGGGAMLEYMEGKVLPGVAAIGV
ncbi:MAG: phosphoglycerate kinase [Bacteroidales bacterium]|nr:phosphoglycerate kinase [Lentimicrobiaceae bacterium]MDD5693832.1 phosphoglycerate kinase [Bacteroidales bacterium]